MKFTKRLLVLALLVVLVVPILGCGVGVTPAENRRAATRVVDFDARMLVDDMALFLQLDRPLRNSRWVID